MSYSTPQPILLLLIWLQIPQICYPMAQEKGSSSRSATPTGVPGDAGKSAAESRKISLQNLAALVPDLSNMIINLYARAANFQGESLPQLPFSETVLRLSKLQTAIHLAGGVLDDAALAIIVKNTPFPSNPKLRPPRVLISPTRTEITAMAFRAFPPPTAATQVTLIDHTRILSGICSILSSLGFHRKKALVLGHLIKVLVPGLINARKAGAAEMGVHPAAGLAVMSSVAGDSGGGVSALGDNESFDGVRDLLSVLGRTYGVVGSAPGITDHVFYPDGEKQENPQEIDSDEAIISRILRNTTLRSFGSSALKMNILGSCINLSEALADFQGVLRFSTELLRTAGTMSQATDFHSLAKEDQVRLYSNISRTVGAARQMGMNNIEAEYWDDFILRNIEVVDATLAKLPLPHVKKELEQAGAIEEKKEKNPFIYNPFLKKPDAVALEKILVAGESAEFRITLQNPFDFDVDVEKVTLESDGAAFESATQGIIVGPFRQQTVYVTGVPKSAGPLKITGCVIKVRGCRERRFPIFRDPWVPSLDTKLKRIGLASSDPPPLRPTSVASSKATSTKQLIAPGPVTSTLNLTVIDQQPTVIVKSTSLSQSAIMVLEAEKRTFTITLQNISLTPVDLVLFSFLDSTTGPLQSAMSNKDISPAELYELELLFSQKDAFRWKRDTLESPKIEPGATATFEVEVLGKPGLTTGAVQIDYSHLGVSKTALEEKFYTRQVVVPLTVTVNASIELMRVDFLPFSYDFSLSQEEQGLDNTRAGTKVAEAMGGNQQLGQLFARMDREGDAGEYCLMLLDLRNAWPKPLEVTLGILSNPPKTEENAFSTTQTLQPGNTTRIILPLPRIYLQNPHAAIPTLNAANIRQYVVSHTVIDPELERANRAAFWYREAILSLIRGSWREEDLAPSASSNLKQPSPTDPRSGAIELRGIRLNPRMVEALRVEEVGITLSLTGPSVSQAGHSRFHAPTDEFHSLHATILNRTSKDMQLILRLQPSLADQSYNVALDLSKRFAWTGLLQQGLGVLKAGETRVVKLGICVLCRGRFEISAAVEEVRVLKNTVLEGESAEEKDRRRMGDQVLGVMGRRSWVVREVCEVVAYDEEEDDD
jgi:trafficking protein particle complex subunit 9